MAANSTRERIDSANGWVLQGYGPTQQDWRVPLRPLPFSIGRQKGCHLQLHSNGVSRLHAEIERRDDGLWIKECGSTNGTFVNHQRVQGSVRLQDGDTVHFGTLGFCVRFERPSPSDAGDSDGDTMVSTQAIPIQQFVETEGLLRLLAQQAVVAYFQPLVQLQDQRIIGYELLGRGGLPDLPANPAQLLEIAQRLDKEVELSLLFRDAGIAQAQHLGKDIRLFFNTVPKEMNPTALRASLQALREQAPELSLVMEVHETAVTDTGMMQVLRDVLSDFTIELAYDDFGAGQARLLELMDTPPDFLKFDMSLIRDIHRRPLPARQVLRNLVAMAHDLGSQTLAEGVETVDELEECIRIGFDCAQGYYFGRPQSAADVFRGSGAVG